MFKFKTLPIAAAIAVAATGLAPTAAHAGDTDDIVRGAVIGGAGGAVLGAIVPGLSVGKGAIIGAGGGAVYGALKKDKRYYTDRRGARYWVDSQGRRRYR